MARVRLRHSHHQHYHHQHQHHQHQQHRRRRHHRHHHCHHHYRHHHHRHHHTAIVPTVLPQTPVVFISQTLSSFQMSAHARPFARAGPRAGLRSHQPSPPHPSSASDLIVLRAPTSSSRAATTSGGWSAASMTTRGSKERPWQGLKPKWLHVYVVSFCGQEFGWVWPQRQTESCPTTFPNTLPTQKVQQPKTGTAPECYPNFAVGDSHAFLDPILNPETRKQEQRPHTIRIHVALKRGMGGDPGAIPNRYPA